MDERYNNGLVLGKFMPPQTGHVYLINTAAAQCVNLYVMICSDDTQPIAGELRYKWLCEIFKGRENIHIIWCTDPNPQYPEDCESVDIFYNKYWVPSVHKYVDKLGVIFTSEEYGDEFARYLGVEHVKVDQPRSHYAISATEIRANPFHNWQYVPKEVRSYFKKSIAILGPESTGKSTLVERLAEHFETAYVKEYGRTYVAVTGTDNLTINDFESIAVGHDLCISLASHTKTLFVDTEAITTKVFADMYLGECKSDIIEGYIKAQEFDLYILLDIDVPWVDDGTRDFPNHRESHLKALKNELESRGIKYVLISGDYEERYKKAIQEVENLFLVKK